MSGLKPESKIWDNFRQGDKLALSQIYNHHADLLFGYGMKFSTDRDLIKDTIQDLFIDLIHTRANLGPTNNIRFYLMRSFRRKLVQNLKQKNAVENGGMLSFEPVIVFSCEEELIGRESRSERDKLLYRSLNELNPRQREILYYRFSCNLEYPEICEIMSLKYDSARKLVFRALESLKCILSETNILQLLFITFLRR